MGVAALVLGIISAVVALFPFCGIIAIIPAIIAIILGIVDIVIKTKKQEKKGMAIAGTIISVLAVIFIIVYNVVLTFITAGVISDYASEFDTYEYYDDYDYNNHYDL